MHRVGLLRVDREVVVAEGVNDDSQRRVLGRPGVVGTPRVEARMPTERRSLTRLQAARKIAATAT